MKHYVLMSDIIGSSQKSHPLLMENFKKATKHMNEKYSDSIISPLTITLGDEFQGIVASLASAVSIIIDLEEFLIEQKFPVKLRYVLVYGEIDTMINTTIAYEMLGSGLSKSRKLLMDLKKSDSRFYVDIENAPLNTILNQAFAIYQSIIDTWKVEKDNELIDSFIKNRDYKLVAEKLNKNRSLMWKREKTLKIASYFSIKAILNTCVALPNNDNLL